MKLCKDCNHHINTLDPKLALCMRAVDLQSPVTGAYSYLYCYNLREKRNLCGPDALLFQPKSGD